MTRLELRHYRTVLALRHHQTVSAAAAALGVTQSAISHRLAEAERRLGRKLTVRSGRKVWLNTAGELLASSAESILNEADHVEAHLISGGEREESQIVRIATFAYNSYRWLPAFLKIVKEKRPNLAFEFVASAPGLPVRTIESGEADLGIMAGRSRPNTSKPWRCSTTSSSVSAQKSSIDREALPRSRRFHGLPVHHLLSPQGRRV